MDRAEPGRRLEFVVAANRLPVRWREEDETWLPSPGGLVSALTPILRERRGAWVGWTGLPAHRPDPFEHEGIDLRPVSISAQEVTHYYRGFCNATIWPLYHDAIRTPEYHRHWWQPYQAVNRRFASRVAACLSDAGIVWVHDYQLQLVPGFIRERRPEARIGHFMHIPFPPVELFGQLPWRTEILEGLLGSDVLSFQTWRSAANFTECATRYTSATAVGEGLQFGGRQVRLEWAPISIDALAFGAEARTPAVQTESASLRDRLGPDRTVLLAVDRLDYTKGIGYRLKALETFFDRYPEVAAGCAMLQIAVPSRTRIPDYVEMREEVERLVGQFNGRFGRAGYTPITYLYRALPRQELVACYRAADVMLVTPLRDGMNLVAKEYVATRYDDTGTLVLSEFAGAASELDRAILVNPYDVNGIAETLAEVARQPTARPNPEMAALREHVMRHDVFRWSERCLEALDAVGSGAGP